MVNKLDGWTILEAINFYNPRNYALKSYCNIIIPIEILILVANE